MRPLAVAAIADVALVALAFRRRWWLLGASGLAVAIVAVAVLAIGRRATPTYPVSDHALIELATINALDGRQLHGPYSRYGWRHPGPLLFYFLAPFYAATGSRTAGLAAGALMINLAALASVCVAIRSAGPLLTIALTSIFAMYLARVSGLLVSAWNAHIVVIASVALVVNCAAVAAGHVRLLPLLAVVASFLVQTHIGTFPLAAVSGALVAAAMGYHWRTAAAEERTVLKTQANRAAWLVAALWLLPVAEELDRPVGNLSVMWQFAQQPGRTAGLAQAFDSWASMITGVLHSGLTVPRGRLLVQQTAAWPWMTAITQLILLAAVVAWAARRRERLHAWIAAHSLAASVVGLWAVTRIPDGIHDHQLFWMSAVGALGIASILAAAGTVISERWQAIWSSAPMVAWVSAALLLIGVSLAGLRQMTLVEGTSQSTPADDHVMRATRAIQAEIERQSAQRPMVVIDQRVWDSAAGVILQLRKNGIRVVIEDSLVAMFAGTVAPNGTEDLEIAISGGTLHAQLISRPGNIVVMLNDRLAIDARPLHR